MDINVDFSFQAQRDGDTNKEMNKHLKDFIVNAAIDAWLIREETLRIVPELNPVLDKIAGSMRDDLYRYHTHYKIPLKNPIIQNCFVVAYSKGIEAAYLWYLNQDGKIDIHYNPQSLIDGVIEFGEESGEYFQPRQKTLDWMVYEVKRIYVALQNEIIVKTKSITPDEARYLADIIACGFYWIAIVGVHVSLGMLGYNIQ